MGALTSAEPPPVGADDHVAGEGAEAILYVDLGCPHCAAVWGEIRALPLRLCFRHFPMASKHPRARVLHAATEAAGRQSERAFWEMCDSLFADRGRVDDPHLWERVEALGLDLDGFERERRSTEVVERVQRDFESGIRAGVTGTPTAFVRGRLIGEGVEEALRAEAGGAEARN